jgi:formylglycine-generating enzyme required for sulfatase activity
MIMIPAGDFIMGSPASESGRFADEGPQRKVHISQLAVGKFDVTRGQWAAFVSATNRSTIGGCAWSTLPGSKDGEPNASASWRNLGFAQDDAHPVVCVTYNDAQDYARWLTDRTGHLYRLLTEAEWEYSARAGTITPYPWGSTASHELANYGADICCGTGLASGRDQWLYTSPVGSFPANAFGLYDMHGNVLQWVQDCYAGSYVGLPVDGSADQVVRTLTLSGDLSFLNGTTSCSYRGVRGGDWGDPPAMIRSAARNFGPPPGATLQDYESTGVGFRVARPIE